MQILVVNSGSATQKIALIKIEAEGNLAKTLFENTRSLEDGSSRQKIVAEQLKSISDNLDDSSFDAIGHRVVHGGSKYQIPALINSSVVDDIETLSRLAPIHNPPALESIDFCRKKFSHLPQFAVFDTAFHTTIPEFNYRYAIPKEWFQEHDIRRYGFHGISHQSCYLMAKELVSAPVQKMVSCHLGGGSSVTAILDGKSFDTTMGFTPLEGMVMSTRSGSIDPAIITYLQKEAGHSVSEIESSLNYKSGVLGVSESTSDMKELLASMDNGDEKAKLAFELYIASLKKAIASMAASMGGLELLAFTGGIGENSARVRERIASGLNFLAIELDDVKNENLKSNCLISSNKSKTQVAVVKCDESGQTEKSCFAQIQLTK